MSENAAGISTPSGGGAQSGLGEKFSPDLFTGTGNFSVPIALPPGRNGFQPELTLQYSTGSGNSPFGLGWGISIPGVMRKTDKGIPQYNNETDVFILSGAEDLIAVESADNWTRFQPRTEGLFARIYRFLDEENDCWKVMSKDGLVSWYGTEGARGADPAVIVDPDNPNSIFAWKLTKTVDPFGNTITYEYERDSVREDAYHKWDQTYLKGIKYVDYQDGNETKHLVSVAFEYEDRPDPFSSCKSGFEIRTIKRCSNVHVYTHPVEGDIHTRSYKFWYADNLDDPQWQVDVPQNGASILSRVQVVGYDGTDEESLPPLDFRYTGFKPKEQKFAKLEGNDLPLVSMATPGYELIDLFGNGLPDIVEINGTVRYWRNMGDGRFDIPRLMNEAPNGISLQDPNIQLIDANGDGRTDLLINSPEIAGYYSTTFNASWDQKSFRKYKQAPSFSLADPNVKLIDLDGDGITDALRSGSSFECFYNSKNDGWTKTSRVQRQRIEGFPNVGFDDPRIKWADMTGDGLQDIVLVHNGNITYWPNHGYGNFGKRVIMKNAPRFGQDFDPTRLLLGDIDGDGQADLIYIDTNKVHYAINNSGNGWGDSNAIAGTPTVTNMAGVRLADIHGSGVSGVLFSFDSYELPSRPRWYFLDFTAGIKPYVLHEMDNNMGALTRVQYLSSTRHSLADRFGKSPFDVGGTGDYTKRRPWKTTLPFPVQVVSQVEVIDKISKGKLTTQYFYHHGYWDGGEREFRGFGRVDQRDTETFERYNEEGLQEGEEFNQVTDLEHYSPPTETRNWFHLGPIGDEFGDWEEVNFADEYWIGDPSVLGRPTALTEMLKTLPRRAKRDAYRTMRGTALRTELYALDIQENGEYLPGANGRPYTVTESQVGVRLELAAEDALATEARLSHSGYIFFSHSLGSRTTQWERGYDPMTQLSFTADYDQYGQPLKQLAIAVPRGRDYTKNSNDDTYSLSFDPEGRWDGDELPRTAHPFGGWAEDRYLATISKSVYAQVDDEDQYMVDRACRSTSYEVLNDGTENAFELRDSVLGLELPLADNVHFKILGHSLNFYDGLEYSGLQNGELGVYGALTRSETLVITDAIINEAYDTTPQCFVSGTPNWSNANGYPDSFAGMLQNNNDRLGYIPKDNSVDSNYVTGFYAVTKQVKYDFHDNSVTAKGLVLETQDPFENKSRIEYDDYQLLPLKAYQVIDSGTDYKLTTEAEYDYRVLQAKKITDPNGNQSEFGFTPLGLLEKSAVMGKVGENKGDTLDNPSVRMEYDFFAWKDHEQPVWVKTIQRINHWQDGINDDTIEAVEYTDGFGRLLQTRSLAEDIIFGDPNSDTGQLFGDSGLPAEQGSNADAVGVERPAGSLPNVRVSGWKVYNNKGKVVEQYEPFFDRGFDYQFPFDDATLLSAVQSGVMVRMFYDPRAQVIRTVNPDQSEQWAVFGIPEPIESVTLNEIGLPSGFEPTPWESYSFDANDLAQYTGLASGAIPADHHWTPSSNELDVLGRVVKSVARLSDAEQVVTQYKYDIRGNVLEITDALDRPSFRHVYDLGNKPLKTWNNDAGNSRVVYDCMQKPIVGSDEKGAESLNCYDTLNRLKQAYAKDNDTESFGLRQIIIYGDDTTNSGLTEQQAKDLNLIAVPYKVYDDSGLLISEGLDFKGNILEKSRKHIKDSLLQSESAYLVDWPELDDVDFASDSSNMLEHKAHDGDVNTDGFVTTTAFDALNRIIKVTLPTDVDDNRKEIDTTYNRAGALEKIEFDGSPYVAHLAYNAKGQRLFMALGNDVMTRYTYDSETFRLVRQRTETIAQPQTGWLFESGGSVKQDTAYKYDLIGNIVEITENRTDSGFGTTLAGTQGPTPDTLIRRFTYDPLYRLLTATGREGTNQGHNNIWNDPTSQAPDPGNTREYRRSYQYDLLGNIEKLTHTAHLNSFTRNFGYDTIAANNKLASIEDGSMTTLVDYSYDDAGNTTQSNTERYYEWNQSNQLRFFKIDDGTTVSVYGQYRYAGGNRTKKYVKDASGNYTSTVYVEGVFEYQKLVKGGNTYERNYTHLTDGKSRVATIRAGSAEDDIAEPSFYVIEDHLNSSTARLDASSATVIDREESYPFGETSVRDFTHKRYRYVGKEKDAESGLYYYGARYYSAWSCRFISVDPKVGEQPMFNGYHYTSNNPLNRVDPDGAKDEPVDNGGGKDGSKTATNISIEQQQDGEGNVTGETFTETTAEWNEDGSYTIHSVTESWSVNEKGEVETNKETFVETGTSHEFVSDEGLDILEKSFGKPKESMFDQNQVLTIDFEKPGLNNNQISPPNHESSGQSNSSSPDDSHAETVSPSSLENEVKPLDMIRETATAWVDKTSKLLDWAGDNASKVAKLFRGAGHVLGGLGLLLTVKSFFDDLSSKPTWIAFTKAAIGIGLGVAGFLTVSTPVGWGILAAGFVYGMLDASGVIDSGLMKIHETFVEPTPKPAMGF